MLLRRCSSARSAVRESIRFSGDRAELWRCAWQGPEGAAAEGGQAMAVAHALAAEAPSLGVKLDREVEKLREVCVVSCCLTSMLVLAVAVFHSLLTDTGRTVAWTLVCSGTCV